MKKVLGLVGVAAACGVCCAIPLALPLLGGVAASSLGFAFGWEVAALLGLAAVAFTLFLARRQRAAAAACAPAASGSSSCGCAGSATTEKGHAS